MIILGIDPGLTCTGWGVVSKSGSRLSHVANGQIRTNAKATMAERLVELDSALAEVIRIYKPDSGAVEEVFVNVNPQSTLKLGQARGVAMVAVARSGIPVAEYPTKVIKKALVGTGGAEKQQIQHMLKILLPGVVLAGEDASDALAVAITHANMLGSHR
ncbi:MAG: crossover junction endodeoxyribonuclease RuvC [Novosphingobium sp. 28-62-57]|uniref:crossover junction endodeoxyribonuclease RuvC n=1 Tax=unclassified Novosphingobium TaxID=2644732 RepID=UPI000BD3DE20|nr:MULTISPECIES: crossover junction endodeoxyribonuclease RuvC [unclassified Novosphingobium]OYW50579.1 MAG: crossover junction endodeoxyribonuclease RuvC [Novosphingobium sp. 12-62-10]OYZ11381.1 MAG: crossover junction endodeoxyribonuclease RuvC [Novosphingobium sp. 28-62-57]OZA31087.1 MAG: crossover junction endodeoxyribonuclease RuvC [Novosphingobium sp. 17-62-9]